MDITTRSLFRRAMLLAVLTASSTALLSCRHDEKNEPLQPIRVETAIISMHSSAVAHRYSATADAADGVQLSFASVGTVGKVYVSEGQHVQKGQLLAELDASPARSSYEAAKALLNQAQDAYNRTKPLYEKGVIAKIKWVEIETKLQEAQSAEAIARHALDNTRLVAPRSGHVADMSLEEGQNAAIGLPVMRIVNTSRMKVQLAVPEGEVKHFRIGRPLAVRVAALDGRRYRATVNEVSMVADRLSRTYQVDASLDNADGQLRIGMLCEAWLADDTLHSISIPSRTIQLAPDGSRYVWVAEDGKARRRPVAIGSYIGDSVTVESGLSEGERLIVNGWQKVSSGMDVEEQ